MTEPIHPKAREAAQDEIDENTSRIHPIGFHVQRRITYALAEQSRELALALDISEDLDKKLAQKDEEIAQLTGERNHQHQQACAWAMGAGKAEKERDALKAELAQLREERDKAQQRYSLRNSLSTLLAERDALRTRAETAEKANADTVGLIIEQAANNVALWDALETVLKSAWPTARDNPTMAAAWLKAQATINSTSPGNELREDLEAAALALDAARLMTPNFVRKCGCALARLAKWRIPK